MKIFKFIYINVIILCVGTFSTLDYLYALPGRDYIKYENDSDQHTFMSESIIPLTRPILADTYFLTSSQEKIVAAKAGRTKLSNSGYEIPFNRKGYPVFESEYTAKLKSSQYRLGRAKHVGIANKQLIDEMNRTSSLRKLFTPQQLAEIERLKKAGNLTEKGLASLTPKGYTWHHSEKKGILELVRSTKHNPGYGGVYHYGGYNLWAKEPTWLTYRMIATRWSYFAFTDFAFQIAHNYMDDKWDNTINNLTGVTISWGAASITESILIRFIPASIGGPASLSASAAYISSRFIVDKCWDEYLKNQLAIQELACLDAERKARMQKTRRNIDLNEGEINTLLKIDNSNLTEGR